MLLRGDAAVGEDPQPEDEETDHSGDEVGDHQDAELEPPCRRGVEGVQPGDLVGLQQEFGDVSAHGIEALTDCSLCVFQNDSLWALFREHPRLGYDITWLSAHEEGHVDDNLLTAGRRNATERVAMLIMHLYRRLDRIGLVEDGTVAFPLNQQHIADALGLSLVHTNRTLRGLSRLGLHEIKNGRLRLLNTRALARIAEYYDTPPRLMPLL